MKRLPLFIGITGSLGMALADVVLLGLPVAGSEYDMYSFGAMTYITEFRALTGSIAGLVCAFLICFGFWYLREHFAAQHPMSATLIFICFCSVEFFGGAFHAGYYFLSGSHAVTDELLNRFTQYLAVISWLALPGYVAGCILLFRLTANRLQPYRLRFANPLLFHGVVCLIVTLIPAPIGGYIKPAFINIGFFLFFVSVLWWSNSRHNVPYPR